MFTRIVYSSTAAPDLGVDDINDILEVARRNNATTGVTGLLLLAGREFIQMLEGDEVDIDRLLKSIKSDKRHTGMEVHTRDQCEHRVFSQWAMAYSVIDEEGMKKLGGTFDVKIAKEFVSYLDGKESYLKPVFKEIFDKMA